jgi:hypothetical protein
VDDRTKADTSLSPESFTQMLREMDKEARASVVKEMLNQDFSTGPN